MGLSNSRVDPVIAVSDMSAAKAFYEGKLGLSGGDDQPDGGHTYPCGDGSSIHVYPSPGNAGKSEATLVGWRVDNIDSAVDELAAKGVTFERYADPFQTDEKGIARFGDAAVAWFKDPDGNTLSIGTQ